MTKAPGVDAALWPQPSARQRRGGDDDDDDHRDAARQNGKVDVDATGDLDATYRADRHDGRGGDCERDGDDDPEATPTIGPPIVAAAIVDGLAPIT